MFHLVILNIKVVFFYFKNCLGETPWPQPKTPLHCACKIHGIVLQTKKVLGFFLQKVCVETGSSVWLVGYAQLGRRQTSLENHLRNSVSLHRLLTNENRRQKIWVLSLYRWWSRAHFNTLKNDLHKFQYQTLPAGFYCVYSIYLLVPPNNWTVAKPHSPVYS